jgi:hypothetical protein
LLYSRALSKIKKGFINMITRPEIFALILLSGMCTSLSMFAAEVEDNCADCHDEAPISADHMELDEFTLEECQMCHEAASDDLLFTAIHSSHAQEEVECDSCHPNGADADQKARLDKLLGR